MEYRHTQTGLTAVFVVLGFGILFVFLVAVAGDETAVLIATGLGLLAIAALVVAFNRLTVEVDSDRVRVAFGWGWPRRSIDLADMTGFSAVRNKWYYGWGIRKVPRGWMYNVWGLDAVEVDLASGKTFRIGTDEPADLVAALTLNSSMRR